MTAVRIQRQRVKGWRAPEGAVYVGRGSKWGNPWRAGGQIILTGKRALQRSTAADVVAVYRSALLADPEAVATARRELAGKTLMCWCAEGEPCHGDVLLAVASGELP